LPRDARLFPGGREDKFLGYEDVDAPGGRRRASVWGWFEHDSSAGGYLVEVGYHKVFVSVRTGWPVREEQALYGEGGGASSNFVVAAFVEFSYDHASAGFGGAAGQAATAGVAEGWFLGMPDVEASVFALPEDCTVVRTQARRPDNPAPPAEVSANLPPPGSPRAQKKAAGASAGQHGDL
jgi:hypothetical protein